MIVDSGNLANTPDKLAITTSLMAKMHYDAIGIGAYDRRDGDAFFKEVKKNGLTVLDCWPDSASGVESFVMKNVDGVDVGIISFGAPKTDKSSDFEVRKARFAAFVEARKKSDLLILLDQANVANRDWIERNRARVGAPDIVIGGLPRATQVQQTVVGSSHIVPTITEGNGVGVVDVMSTRGHAPTIVDPRIVMLNDKIQPDAEVAKLISAFNASSIKPAAVVSAPTLPGAKPVPQKGNVYYSPVQCKACHEREDEDWRKSKHASALASLVDAKQLTPECLPCHSEMFRRLQRVSVPNDNIAGVECATCHFNSLPHGAERRSAAMKVLVDKTLCVTCHTKDRSPDYNETTYFPKVVHAIGKVASTH